MLLVASGVAAGCSSPRDATAPDEGAIGTFSAELRGGSAVTSLRGAAATSRDENGADFSGLFNAYPIATGRDGASFTFTMITLRATTGQELVLGHVSPTADLPSGTFVIETGRDLKAPFGFVALLRDPSVPARTMATDGRVTVTAADGRLQGRFALRLSDDRTLEGTFIAAARR